MIRGVDSGVEMDKEKMVYHLEEAAIGGHPQARYSLVAVAAARYNTINIII